MHLLKSPLACFLLLPCVLWLSGEAGGREPGPGFYCGPYATALPSRLQVCSRLTDLPPLLYSTVHMASLKQRHLLWFMPPGKVCMRRVCISETYVRHNCKEKVVKISSIHQIETVVFSDTGSICALCKSMSIYSSLFFFSLIQIFTNSGDKWLSLMILLIYIYIYFSCDFNTILAFILDPIHVWAFYFLRLIMACNKAKITIYNLLQVDIMYTFNLQWTPRIRKGQRPQLQQID